MKRYHVISPDGFPIRRDPFPSIKQAAQYTRKWCEAFKHQGYYLTGGRDRIPADELVNHLRLVPANKFWAVEEPSTRFEKLVGQGRVGVRAQGEQAETPQPISERSLATVRAAVRERWEAEQQTRLKKTITPQSPAKTKHLKPEEPEF
jgi:hypothetical protein